VYAFVSDDAADLLTNVLLCVGTPIIDMYRSPLERSSYSDTSARPFKIAPGGDVSLVLFFIQNINFLYSNINIRIMDRSFLNQ
jgi:hypothetical protein